MQADYDGLLGSRIEKVVPECLNHEAHGRLSKSLQPERRALRDIRQ